MTHHGRTMPLFDVRVGPVPAFNAIQKIADMRAVQIRALHIHCVHQRNPFLSSRLRGHLGPHFETAASQAHRALRAMDIQRERLAFADLAAGPRHDRLSELIRDLLDVGRFAAVSQPVAPATPRNCRGRGLADNPPE